MRHGPNQEDSRLSIIETPQHYFCTTMWHTSIQYTMVDLQRFPSSAASQRLYNHSYTVNYYA